MADFILNAASDPAPGWGRGGKKHEIYVAAFGGHLFYDLFVQGWGRGHGSLGTLPGSATVMTVSFSEIGDGNFKDTL